MTTATEPDLTREHEQPAGPAESACARCGAPLAPDQEWCVECGAARTVIHRPRGWRIPLAVVGAVALLFLAGFAIALVNLSSEANRNAAALSTTQTASTSTSPASSSGTQPFARWPKGVTGWTVVLAGSSKRTTAQALAAPIRTSGVDVGILNSSRHRAMAPGQWLVFSGHYPSRPAARARARSLAAQGHPAVVKLVATPSAR